MIISMYVLRGFGSREDFVCVITFETCDYSMILYTLYLSFRSIITFDHLSCKMLLSCLRVLLLPSIHAIQFCRVDADPIDFSSLSFTSDRIPARSWSPILRSGPEQPGFRRKGIARSGCAHGPV